MDETSFEFDFFVSRAGADRDWAEWIAWQLEEFESAPGRPHRVLLQDWDFVPGSNWVERMEHAVRSAAKLVPVLSPAYLDGDELGAAEWRAFWGSDPLGRSNRIVPVRVWPCTPAGLLASVTSIDLVGLTEEDAAERLRAGVHAASTGRAKPLTSPGWPGGHRAVRRRPGFPSRRTAATAAAAGFAVGAIQGLAGETGSPSSSPSSPSPSNPAPDSAGPDANGLAPAPDTARPDPSPGSPDSGPPLEPASGTGSGSAPGSEADTGPDVGPGNRETPNAGTDRSADDQPSDRSSDSGAGGDADRNPAGGREQYAREQGSSAGETDPGAWPGDHPPSQEWGQSGGGESGGGESGGEQVQPGGEERARREDSIAGDGGEGAHRDDDPFGFFPRQDLREEPRRYDGSGKGAGNAADSDTRTLKLLGGLFVTLLIALLGVVGGRALVSTLAVDRPSEDTALAGHPNPASPAIGLDSASPYTNSASPEPSTARGPTAGPLKEGQSSENARTRQTPTRVPSDRPTHRPSPPSSPSPATAGGAEPPAIQPPGISSGEEISIYKVDMINEAGNDVSAFSCRETATFVVWTRNASAVARRAPVGVSVFGSSILSEERLIETGVSSFSAATTVPVMGDGSNNLIRQTVTVTVDATTKTYQFYVHCVGTAS